MGLGGVAPTSGYMRLRARTPVLRPVGRPAVKPGLSYGRSGETAEKRAFLKKMKCFSDAFLTPASQATAVFWLFYPRLTPWGYHLPPASRAENGLASPFQRTM